MTALDIYLVGGAVRDELLDMPVVERDWVVVGASEEDLVAAGFQKVGKDFPVFLHPETKEEYAMARREKKVSKGYYGFDCDYSRSVTLEEDLKRRDLTINAIAKDKYGRLIDPYGGQADLKRRILRHVSPHFAEDPLRVLRVARFHAKLHQFKFKVADETMFLMQSMVQNGELNELAKERIWLEMVKALSSATAWIFFTTLKQCGALDVLFPALSALWGVPQKATSHPEIDTGVHTIMALKQACKLTQDPVVRFAVLCHDLGKGTTEKSQLPSHQGHAERSVELIQTFCRLNRVPNKYKDFAIKVARYHGDIHGIHADKTSAEDFLRLLENLGVLKSPDLLWSYVLAVKADALGRLGHEHDAFPQEKLLQDILAICLSVDTKLLREQGFKGKALGEKIREQQIASIQHYLDDLLSTYPA